MGYAAYGTEDIMPYDKDVDIEQEIRNCAKSGEELAVAILFDEEFKYLEAVKHIGSDGKTSGSFWMFCFEIEDEKIKNILIMKSAAVFTVLMMSTNLERI